jgi:hypothetical protein
MRNSYGVAGTKTHGNPGNKKFNKSNKNSSKTIKNSLG